MKKISFTSISIALLIGFFYTFVLCMVDDADEHIITSEDYTTSSEYVPVAETEYLGTADASEGSDQIYEKYIQTSWWKANLSAYTSSAISSAAITSPSASVSAVTTAKITTTAVPTTAAQTTTVKTTTTTKAPATTVTTTVPSTTVSTAIPTTDEKLNYTVSGTKYSGNAYDIVCQIVEAEMSSDFNEEALKAQAIASYSFLKYNNKKGVSPSVSVKTNVSAKVANAVKSVFGLTAYYNGSVAQTVYCSSTGGATASAKNVWGSDVPYLQSVTGDYDSYDRYYGVKKTFSEAEVRSIIQTTTGLTLSNNPANWFSLLPAENGGVLDGGYVGNMLIDGNSCYTKNGSNVNITGRVLRENIFAFRLNSAKFTVSYADGTFTFTTYGSGHGVGMSQLGANLYASMGGFNYMQILQHYFPGITVS